MIKTLSEIEKSNDRPLAADLPLTRWRDWKELPTKRDLYGPAFKIEDLAQAERYFVELLAWRVRMDFARGLWRTWAQLVAHERQEMAWFALAVDASALNCAKGIPPTLAKIGRLYGAFLPEKCRIGKPAILPEAMEIQNAAAMFGQKVSDQDANAQARKVQARKRYDWQRDQKPLFS